MSFIAGIRQELEATKLQPIEIEINEQQLIKIGIAVVLMSAIVFAMKAVLTTLTK